MAHISGHQHIDATLELLKRSSESSPNASYVVTRPTVNGCEPWTCCLLNPLDVKTTC